MISTTLEDVRPSREAAEYTLASGGVAVVLSHVFVTIAVAAALHNNVIAPGLGRPIELKPGEATTIEGLRITFDGVRKDSRCPTGAQCVWAGDASAVFTLEKPPAGAQHATLHTSSRFERQSRYDAFVVRLVDVKPHPTQELTIAAGDYRATIVVTRR
jgi:hypothetical protein